MRGAALLNFGLRMTAAAIIMLGCLLGSPAFAQQDGQEFPRDDDTTSPQAVISADQITYDDSLDSVFASGNVEVAHGERLLLADSIRYNQGTDSVVASGNVVLLEPGGEVLFADYMELSQELRSGVIENLRILLADDSRFAANGARRIDGRKTVMRKAVYSPCDVCAKDPTRPPLWQLKASTIIHDQEDRDVTYRNARLELYGVPVFYSPFLRHPDPTVERRSGLLAPRGGTTTAFGGYARLPLFITFGDSADVTIEPIITTKENPVLALEYRQRFNAGEVTLSGSGTKSDRETGDPLNPTIEEDDFRGHLFALGNFNIDDSWRWGFEYKRASDPTYLDRYDFFGNSGETLESRAFVEGFRRRTYTAFNAFGYQDLQLTDPVEEPLVLPSIDHNFLSEADAVGGRWSFDANFRSTVRDQGVDTRRLSIRGGYALPMISDFGLVSTVSASLQADGYHMDQVVVDGQPENNLTAGRIIPRAALELRYPFVRGTSGVRQLVEPIAAIIAAPNNGNPSEIPQEDSVVVELDETNLFNEDQIPGLDRADTGQRAVAGLRAGLYGENGGRLETFIGQSYRFENPDRAGDIGDLRNGRSDYVGRLEFVPSKYMDLLYRFRSAESDLTLLRSETSLTLGPPAFRLVGDHIYIATEASNGLYPDREEVNAELSSQLTDFWSLAASTRQDLTSDGGTLEHGLRMTYEDECFKLEARFRRDFTRSLDVEEETVVALELVFKHLGNVSAQQRQSR